MAIFYSREVLNKSKKRRSKILNGRWDYCMTYHQRKAKGQRHLAIKKKDESCFYCTLYLR